MPVRARDAMIAAAFAIGVAACFSPVGEGEPGCPPAEVVIPFVSPDGGQVRDPWGVALWSEDEPDFYSYAGVSIGPAGTTFVDGLNAVVSADLGVTLLSAPDAPFGEQVAFRRWLIAGPKVFKSYAHYTAPDRSSVLLGLHEYRPESAMLVDHAVLLEIGDAGFGTVPSAPQADPNGQFLCFGASDVRGDAGTVYLQRAEDGRRVELERIGRPTCWQVRREHDGAAVALLRAHATERGVAVAEWSLLRASPALDSVTVSESVSAYRCAFVEGSTATRVVCSVPSNDGTDIVSLDGDLQETARWPFAEAAIVLGARLVDGQLEYAVALGSSPSLMAGLAIVREGRAIALRRRVGLPAAVAPTKDGWMVAGPSGDRFGVVLSRWCNP